MIFLTNILKTLPNKMYILLKIPFYFILRKILFDFVAFLRKLFPHKVATFKSKAHPFLCSIYIYSINLGFLVKVRSLYPLLKRPHKERLALFCWEAGKWMDNGNWKRVLAKANLIFKVAIISSFTSPKRQRKR